MRSCEDVQLLVQFNRSNGLWQISSYPAPSSVKYLKSEGEEKHGTYGRKTEHTEEEFWLEMQLFFAITIEAIARKTASQAKTLFRLIPSSFRMFRVFLLFLFPLDSLQFADCILYLLRQTNVFQILLLARYFASVRHYRLPKRQTDGKKSNPVD
jgi:hypothetical protein